MDWEDFTGILLVVVTIALLLAVLAGFAGLIVYFVRLGWNAAA